MRHARIDRREIIVAVILHAAPRQIDEGLHIRPDRRRFVEKSAQGAAQRISIEVARADDVESRRLQGLRDEAGVVRRGASG